MTGTSAEATNGDAATPTNKALANVKKNAS